MKLRHLIMITPLLLGGVALAANSTDGVQTAAPNASVSIDASNPVSLMTGITDKLLAQLKIDRQKIKSDPSYIYQVVDQVLVPYVDTEGMSRSVLGRNAWTTATATEQQAFTKAFIQVVVRTYASALNAYTDQTVKYFPVRGGVGNRTRVQIESQIERSDGPPVGITYRLAKVNGQWKVYDMSVEGVGLLQSFRAQIQAELSQGMSLTALTQKLEAHNANNSQS